MKKVFPTALEEQHPQGPYQDIYKYDIDAVSVAAAWDADRDLIRAREVSHRSFLERHNHDGAQLKKQHLRNAGV